MRRPAPTTSSTTPDVDAGSPTTAPAPPTLAVVRPGRAAHRAPTRRAGPAGRGRRAASCASPSPRVTLVITTVVMMNVRPPQPAEHAVATSSSTTTRRPAATWAPTSGARRSCATTCCRNLQLSGWSMDWYAGFPMYRFYMVVPALVIVALDTVLPVRRGVQARRRLGLVTLPLCCWAFGRLARFRYPMPELFAFAGLCFLFDESFSIYGGNVKTTMAGEFSFSIALSLMILGSGLLAAGMQTAASTATGRRSCSRSPSSATASSRSTRARRARSSCSSTWTRSHAVRATGSSIGLVRDPAVGVLGRAVPRQPRVHDRHEVRRPPGRRRPTRSGTCSSR